MSEIVLPEVVAEFAAERELPGVPFLRRVWGGTFGRPGAGATPVDGYRVLTVDLVQALGAAGWSRVEVEWSDGTRAEFTVEAMRS